MGLAGCNSQRPLHTVKADAEFAAQRGDYEKAQADFGEYIRRRPEAAEMRYELAKVQIAAGQPKPAIEELNIALDIEPLNDSYLDAQAQAMFNAGERDGLISLLSRNASERGRVSDFLRLGTYSAKIGNVDEAKQAFATAAKLDGGLHVTPQRTMADFYGSLGDRTNQIKHLRMAYFIEPANPDTLKEIRRVGEIPGPTFALRPDDLAVPAPAQTRQTAVPDKN
jgi:tetratricopeptide (TPR) repeat protein